MNNKRQTIWLVSMLSLMVILSAYYLFTSDVTPVQKADNGALTADPAADAAKASAGSADGIQVSEVDSATGGVANGGTTGKNAADQGTTGKNAADQGTTGKNATDQGTTAGTTDKNAAGAADGKTDTSGVNGANGTADTTGQAAAGRGVTPSDAAVIKEMTNLKGSQYITDLQRQRLEEHSKKSEELQAIVADTKKHTQEQASKAFEDLAKLDDTDSRITSLEEKLLQDFDNAVVTEEALNFKVVVQSPKLEKKQAVQIIDMAVKELNIRPEHLSVQYVR